MTYRQNLGKVKGDRGKVYTPKPVTRDNKRYITWTLQEENDSIPEDIDITPKVYIPQVDDEGNISFLLATEASDSIPPKNIRGIQGPAGAVNTNIVTSLPPKSEAKEGVIYIDINNDGIASVFDEETNDFYPLDNLLKFNNYLTTFEIQEQYYNKHEINDMFGDIMTCQENLITLLDKDSIINIPSDD